MGYGLDVVLESHRPLDAFHVERDCARIKAHFRSDLVGVVLDEVAVDASDFGEQVQVRGQRCDRAVDEDEILYVEHEMLGELRAVRE